MKALIVLIIPQSQSRITRIKQEAELQAKLELRGIYCQFLLAKLQLQNDCRQISR